MVNFRRGKARSLYELEFQVKERRRLTGLIEELEIEKRTANARFEARKKTLGKKIDRLDRNITRFYFEEGARFFKKGTKTIFTRFGSVGSKRVKKLTFHRSRAEVIVGIINAGRVPEFLSVKLKEGALKKDPDFAKLVGLEVFEDDELLISPPAANTSNP